MTDPVGEPWWWLSFADGDLPKGQQFLGACIVRGTEPIMGHPRPTDPVPEAWRQGCNPGGEVAMHRVPDDREPPAEWCNRLLTREECAALDAVMLEKYGVPDAGA
jgi:hypothetical protein